MRAELSLGGRTVSVMQDGHATIAFLHLQRIEDVFRRHCHAQLDETDIARLARFVMQRARDEYIAGRALLRTMLSRRTGIAPQVWRFRVDDFGKPYIVEPASCAHLHFSISHTPGLVACAIAHDSRIGVDVEHTGGEVDRHTLGAMMLTPGEAAQIDALSMPRQRGRFFALWTLKEAYVKALGRGLSFPMKSFEFLLRGDEIHLRSVQGTLQNADRWRFVSSRPSENDVMAIAIEN